MIAYIPARIGSKRIPQKNIKHLGGKPIICHVIENLSQCSDISVIAVSTDSPEVINIVKHYPKVETLALRADEYSNDDATFMDLVKNDLSRFCTKFCQEEVIFTLATAALIKTEVFQLAITTYLKQKSGLLLSVNQLESPPRLALELTESNILEPLDKSAYLLPTKELKPAFVDAGAFYIFNYNDMQHHSMFLDLTPLHPFCLDKNTGIDIDTLADWQRLEDIYYQENQ